MALELWMMTKVFPTAGVNPSVTFKVDDGSMVTVPVTLSSS